MRSLRFLTVAPASVLLIVAVGGCGGLRPLADVEREQARGNWLCEGASNGGWDCIDDKEAVQRAAARHPSTSATVNEVAPPPASSRSPISAADRARQQELLARVSREREGAASPPAATERPPTDATPRSEQPAAPSEEVADRTPPPAIERAPAPAVEQTPVLPVVEQAPAPPVPPPNLPLYRRLSEAATSLDLLALPADYYALQLLAMSSQEALDSFAAEQGLQGALATRVARDGKIFHVLLAGVYADQAAAEQALGSLPATVRALRPWIRPVGLLQKAIRQAGDMADR